jgi:hypothetical protein
MENLDYPFEIGKNYLIRTVTFTHTGKITKICGGFLVLETACWIADTGHFSEAVKDSNVFSEVEPFLNPVIVGLGAIVDATEIAILPTRVK